MESIYNKNSVLGSAKWWDHEEVNDENALHLLGSQFIIGNGRKGENGKKGRIIVEPKRHLISVAPTRAGKNVSLITPNLLHNNRSAIVIDPKGELTFLTAKRRRDMGQSTFILDPFDEFKKNYGERTGETEVLTNFNPFSSDDSQIEEKIRYIAESLIVIQGSEPHWSESSLELVEGILALMIKDPKIDASLPKFRSILTQTYKKLGQIAIDAQELPENSIARRKLGRFATLNLSENKELCSIISTAITQTAFLDDPELSECLSSTTPGFSLDCLTEGGDGSTIYLIIPFDKLQSHGRWLRLMVSLAIRAVYRSPNTLDHSVLFVLDEFGNIGPLPAITSAFTMGAGRQILLWAFVQGLTQLKRDYPHDWEIFIGNSDHLTFFDIMDEFTADYVSKLLGKTTVSVTPNNRDSAVIHGPGFPSFKTDQAQYYSRDLLQSSEIRRLPSKYGILIHRDEPPILYEKIEYFNDPLCDSLARKDPYFKDKG